MVGGYYRVFVLIASASSRQGSQQYINVCVCVYNKRIQPAFRWLRQSRAGRSNVLRADYRSASRASAVPSCCAARRVYPECCEEGEKGFVGEP